MHSLEQLVQLSGCADVASFHMFVYKMRPCSFSEPHPWQNCPYSHVGERARRRDFRYFRYSSAMCPNISTERGSGRSCPEGDACSLSHNVFEVWLHPEKYRTQLCPEAGRCQRMHCWYAHSQSDMRQSCDIPEVLPTAVAAAAAPGELSVVSQAARQQASPAPAAGTAPRTAAGTAGRQQLVAGRASSSRGSSIDRTKHPSSSHTEPGHPASGLQPQAQGVYSVQQQWQWEQRRSASAQQLQQLTRQPFAQQRRSLDQRQGGLQPPYAQQLLQSPGQQAGPLSLQQRQGETPQAQGLRGWAGNSPLQAPQAQHGLGMHVLQHSQAMQQAGMEQSMSGAPQAAYMQVPMQQWPQPPPPPGAAGAAAVSLGHAQQAWLQQQRQQQALMPYYSTAMNPASPQFQQQLMQELPPAAAGFQQVQGQGVYQGQGQQAFVLAQQQGSVSQGFSAQQIWVMPAGVPYPAAAAVAPGAAAGSMAGGAGGVYVPGQLPPAYDSGVQPPGALMVGGGLPQLAPNAAAGPYIPVSLGVVDLSHMAAAPSAGSSGAALHRVPVDGSATLLGSVTPQPADFAAAAGGAAGVYAAQGGSPGWAVLQQQGPRRQQYPQGVPLMQVGTGGELMSMQQLMQQMRLQGEPPQ